MSPGAMIRLDGDRKVSKFRAYIASSMLQGLGAGNA